MPDPAHLPIPTRIGRAFIAAMAAMTTADGYLLDWQGYSPSFDDESPVTGERTEADGVAKLDYLGAANPNEPPERRAATAEHRQDAWLLTLYVGPGPDRDQPIDERLALAAADGARLLYRTALPGLEVSHGVRRVLGPELALLPDTQDLYAVRLIAYVTYACRVGRIDRLPGEPNA